MLVWGGSQPPALGGVADPKIPGTGPPVGEASVGAVEVTSRCQGEMSFQVVPPSDVANNRPAKTQPCVPLTKLMSLTGGARLRGAMLARADWAPAAWLPPRGVTVSVRVER